MNKYFWHMLIVCITIHSLNSFAQNQVTPLQIYPAGTKLPIGASLKEKVCETWDRAPEHSCAYKKYKNPVKPTPVLNTDYKAIATNIMTAMKFSTVDMTAKLLDFEKYLKKYDKDNCLNTGLSYQITNSGPLTLSMYPIKRANTATNGLDYFNIGARDISEIRNKVEMLNICKNLILMTSSTGSVDKLTLADVQSAWQKVDAYVNIFNNQFAIDQTASIFTYWPATASANTIYDEISKGAPINSANVAAYNEVKQVDMPADYNVIHRVYFCDNEPTITTEPINSPFATASPTPCIEASSIPAIEELALFQSQKLTPLQLEISTIELSSTSSTLNNTANYCAKDFENLSADRAVAVKKKIENDPRFNAVKITIAKAGINSDGSTGPCAYKIENDNLKEVRSDVTKSALNDHRRVDIHVTGVKKINQPGNQWVKIPWTLGIKRQNYSVTMSCLSEPTKNLSSTITNKPTATKKGP